MCDGVGRSPPAVCELVVEVFLPSEKIALICCFKYKFELYARISIAVNKLDAYTPVSLTD